MATRQLKNALASIEKRQRDGAIASIILSLGGEKRGLSNNHRGTVRNAVMKQIKVIKTGIAKGTHASAFLDMILDGTWPITIPEVKKATEEAGTDID